MMKLNALALAGLLAFPMTVMAQERPNIVLVFMDNFGWGEPGFNGGGIIRGAATPRLDRLADEGLRPSPSTTTTRRLAILTGR
jgi:arylsulfatase A-like enzyme